MIDNLKILIIEDTPSDAELLQYELKKSGLSFSSEIVQTETDFIAALDSFMPDIILSDYSLPSFDGITAFHINQQRQSDIPFIIVSGSIGEENAVELIKSGLTDYVLKDKLYSLAPKVVRAIKEVEELTAKRIIEEKLKLQNEKLFEIAFLQSHQVRVPITHILGFYSIFNFDDPSDPVNAEILGFLKESAESLDVIIHDITKKIEEIKAIM